MKSLLLKVPQDAADRFFAGQTSCLPCSQIPDMAHVLPPDVFVCVDGEVTGRGHYAGAKVQRESFVNSKPDHYGYNVAWLISEPRLLPEPLPLAALHLKRAPEEWRWVKH